MKHLIALNEEQRQVVLLALAELALERPGWDSMIHDIVVQIDPEPCATFVGLRNANQDRVKQSREPLVHH